jgi:hypothetical protein
MLKLKKCVTFWSTAVCANATCYPKENPMDAPNRLTWSPCCILVRAVPGRRGWQKSGLCFGRGRTASGQQKAWFWFRKLLVVSSLMFKEHAVHNAVNIIWMKRFRLSSEQVLCRFSDQAPNCSTQERYVKYYPGMLLFSSFPTSCLHGSHMFFGNFGQPLWHGRTILTREPLFAKNVPVLKVGFGFFWILPSVHKSPSLYTCISNMSEVRGGTCSKFATKGVIKRINMYSCSSIDPRKGRALQQCHKKICGKP